VDSAISNEWLSVALASSIGAIFGRWRQFLIVDEGKNCRDKQVGWEWFERTIRVDIRLWILNKSIVGIAGCKGCRVKMVGMTDVVPELKAQIAD
jgi:hypothetical protein